jgi:uncharacterized alkaline shock family protein YloU
VNEPTHDTTDLTDEVAGTAGPADEVVGATDLADEVAGAVRRCPDVAELSSGPFETVATYLPGRKVSGVALRDDEVEVSIVVRQGRPLPEIADEVRAAIAPLVGGRPVNVHIGGMQ